MKFLAASPAFGAGGAVSTLLLQTKQNSLFSRRQSALPLLLFLIGAGS